jgi:hypothetical protein
MIDVYHLAGAAPIAMIGMFALWAAASKWHWFLRTVIVAVVVLATLLIPAYELAYQLGIESLLVVAGMAIWRRLRGRPTEEAMSQVPSRRFSLSLQTLMLTVVIVAVATAVVARTPPIEPHQWYSLFVNGLMPAVICLACVWLAFGKTRWRIRFVAAPFLVIAWAVAMHFLQWGAWAVRHWTMSATPFSDFWQGALLDSWRGIIFWTISIGLGMAVLWTWMLLMRAAGWFDPFHRTTTALPNTPTAQRRVALARWATVILFCLVSLFPVAFFYRLLTPTPIPKAILPEPNGFDDFVAAGRMAIRVAPAKLVDQFTDVEMSAELSRLSAAFERMHEGLMKETVNPYVFKPWEQDDAQALVDLLYAVELQAAFARRSKDVELELANRMDLLLLAHAESRGKATENYNSVLGHGEWYAHADI